MTKLPGLTIAHPGAYPGELAEAALDVVAARKWAEETRGYAEKAAHESRLADEAAETAEILAAEAVTARKRAEAKLEAAEANLKRIIEAAP